MTEQTNTDAPVLKKKKNVVLVFSTKPNRRDELEAELNESAGGRDILESFFLDAFQVTTFAQAKDALRRGADLPGTGEIIPHLVLMIGGEVAKKLGKAKLDELAAGAANQWRLGIMGLSDRDDEKKAIEALGIKWIVEKGAVGNLTHGQFASLIRELNARSAERAAALAPPVSRPVFVQHSSEGLFPGRAIIAVHAAKGGTGKSMVAANVAWGLSLSGKRVVLADFNADSAHVDRIYQHWIKKTYGNRADVFDERGLTWLASRLQTDRNAPFSVEDLEQATLKIDTGNSGQHLAILPGVYTQTDYEGGGQISAVGGYVTDKRIVDLVINLLQSPNGGYDYVVIDTGTGRLNQLTRVALARADLVLFVVDASSYPPLEADEEELGSLIAASETQRATRIVGKRILVPNRLAPRGTQDAPQLDQIKSDFDFLRGVGESKLAVLPCYEDAQAMRTSGKVRKPVLDIPEFAGKPDQFPLYRDLTALVNTIVRVYDDEGKSLKGEKRGFGRFIGRS